MEEGPKPKPAVTRVVITSQSGPWKRTVRERPAVPRTTRMEPRVAVLRKPQRMTSGAAPRDENAQPAYHQITPTLYLGRRPFARELPLHVTRLIDMAPEFPTHRGILKLKSLQYISLPVLDMHAPPTASFLRVLHQIVDSPQPTYVHCALGHGRSATLAAAVLLATGQADSVEAAESQLKTIRPRVRLAACQRRFLITLMKSGHLIVPPRDVALRITVTARALPLLASPPPGTPLPPSSDTGPDSTR